MRIPDIQDRIDELVEDAGMLGLCHDGQREFALDRLITEYSGVNPRMLMHAVEERLGAPARHGRR